MDQAAAMRRPSTCAHDPAQSFRDGGAGRAGRAQKADSLQVLLRRARVARCSSRSARCRSTTRRAPRPRSSSDHAGDIAAASAAQPCWSSTAAAPASRCALLLDALEEPAAYVPIDISRERLRGAAVCSPSIIPQSASRAGLRRLHPARCPLPPRTAPGPAASASFPGSTIGNFDPAEATRLPAHASPSTSDADGGLLIGVDLKKDPAILHAAYNDAAGRDRRVQPQPAGARLNRELVRRFRPRDASRTRPFWNAAAGRIEMHLRSLAAQTVHVAGRSFRFVAARRIHTENSYKYSLDEFRSLALAAGFAPVATWTDAEQLFSVHLLAVATA